MSQLSVHGEDHAGRPRNGSQPADTDVFDPGTDFPGLPSRPGRWDGHIAVPDGVSPPPARASVGSLKTEQLMCPWMLERQMAGWH